MWNLSGIGRIFYGIAIIGTGILTVYYNSLPYWLLPPENFRIPWLFRGCFRDPFYFDRGLFRF